MPQANELMAVGTGTPAGPRFQFALAGLAGASTVIVTIGVTVTLFFNPFWIAVEQDRAGVPALTGFTSGEVRAATDSILADLIFGPPTFAVTVDDQPVLDPAERSHMADVRNVLVPLATVFGVGIGVLAVLVAANRRHPWVWRAVARASAALAIVGVVVAGAVLLFFDQAFLAFHLVFFPQGNFSFDPRTERLPQLFPEAFWTETVISAVVVGVVLAIAVSLGAAQRAKRVVA